MSQSQELTPPVCKILDPPLHLKYICEKKKSHNLHSCFRCRCHHALADAGDKSRYTTPQSELKALEAQDDEGAQGGGRQKELLFGIKDTPPVHIMVIYALQVRNVQYHVDFM